MGRNPDTEDGDVDGSDDYNGTPLDVADCVSMLSDKSNTVDDDLHEQLDLENPEEQDEEQYWNTVVLLALVNVSK